VVTYVNPGERIDIPPQPCESSTFWLTFPWHAVGCGTEYSKNYNAFAGAWAAANGAGAAARAGDASAFAGPGGTSASAGGDGIGISIDSNGRVTTLKSGKAVIDGQTATVFYNLPGGGGTVVTTGPNSMAAASSSG
jgi:hypothetical protein